jgi:hypothetical protein
MSPKMITIRLVSSFLLNGGPPALCYGTRVQKPTMSNHFAWDPVAQKLLLARFGRHGRGA